MAPASTFISKPSTSIFRKSIWIISFFLQNSSRVSVTIVSLEALPYFSRVEKGFTRMAVSDFFSVAYRVVVPPHFPKQY